MFTTSNRYTELMNSCVEIKPYKHTPKQETSLTPCSEWTNMEPQCDTGGMKMTQILGAICDNSRSLLLLADRMGYLSDNAIFTQKKEIIISEKAIALIAGSPHHKEFINFHAIDKTGNIQVLAQALIANYHAYRNHKIETEILPQFYGIMSLKEFSEKHKILHESTIQKIEEKIEGFNLGIRLIFGGVDQNAHLYYISNSGQLLNCDSLGLSVDGVANDRVLSILDFFGYSKGMTFLQVLSIAFVAKKHAEIRGGISKETDAWHITKNEGIRKISESTIAMLEEKYVKIKQKLSGLPRELQIKKNDVKYD